MAESDGFRSVGRGLALPRASIRGMESTSTLKRSSSNSRTSLLHKDLRRTTDRGGDTGIISDGEIGKETSLQRDLAALSVSKRLVSGVSQKLRLKKNSHGSDDVKERENETKAHSGCLGFYGKGGGCKVGSCEGFDINGKMKSSAVEECLPLRVEKTGFECFSYGMSERIWKKNVRKMKETEQPTLSSPDQFSLPDDLLEICLVRLPLTALLTARLVCKKWCYLTTTSHFIQMRSESSHQSPWLFLYGIIKDGCSAGEIHALDVSLDQWHRINADILKGRFLFSVTSIGTDLYVVGGCSDLTNSGTITGKSSLKTHRGVVVFSPLTGTWRKAARMKLPRSGPILGVSEVSSTCAVFHRLPDHRQDKRHLKSRIGEVSDVYEDPHRFSLRRQLQLLDGSNENDVSPESKRKPLKCFRQERSKEPRFVLIAVGGRGSWDEPLHSGEIYDPATDRWMEIAKLPGHFGAVCSGTACNGMFYVYSETDKLAGFDLERGVWVEIQTSCPPPRLHEYYPKLVSCNDRLFMLCVSWCERDRQLRREKAVRKLWELDLALLSWTEVSRHPDAPMDWNAAFVTDRNRIYGVEMFKIFGQVLDFLTVCDISDTELKWSRISSKHAAHEADASSCTTKLMVVLQL